MYCLFQTNDKPRNLIDNKSVTILNFVTMLSTNLPKEHGPRTRSVTDSMKKNIAGRQFFKCANSPLMQLEKLEDYKCPLWQKSCENRGSFDQSGYDIDHIIEFAISFDDSESNLQALCKSCHSVKTKKFLRNTGITKIAVSHDSMVFEEDKKENKKITLIKPMVLLVKGPMVLPKNTVHIFCDRVKKYGECKINGPYDYGKGLKYRYRWSCCGSQAKSHPCT